MFNRPSEVERMRVQAIAMAMETLQGHTADPQRVLNTAQKYYEFIKAPK